MRTTIARTCEQCGKEFRARPDSKGRFCSRTCWRAFETAQTLMADCLRCGKTFPVKAHQLIKLKGKGRYCSLQCYWDDRSVACSRPLAERFWEKVRKTDGCWIWEGSRDDKGYGRIGINRAAGTILSHRASYELHHGPIPDGLSVLHECDNPSCVRPDHLFLGTQLDNMTDCASKGRTTRGERSATAKLTEVKVIEIRTRFATGGVTFSGLAREYGVSRNAISDIIRGRRWSHLTSTR